MFFDVLNHFQDNRKKIIIIMTVVVLIAFFIKAVNEYTEKQRVNSSSSNNTTAINKNEGISDNLRMKNVVSDSDNETPNTENIEIDESSINSANKAIEAFLFYCNNNQIGKAYNLLTDDCKKISYNTQDDFYNKYFKGVFKQRKNYTYALYGGENSSTYKLSIANETITTGKSNGSNDTIDYITVIKDDNKYKLNIGGFIKKESLNVNKSDEYLSMNVTEKITFMDYELYTITIKNTTLANMNISNSTNSVGTYLVDENSSKYYLKNDEYDQNDLAINYKSSKTIKLKFNRKYISESKKIVSIVFSNINLINRENYDNTEQNQNISGNVQYQKKYTSYKENISFSIEL